MSDDLNGRGWVPTAYGVSIPGHLVQSGRHLLAEMLDLTSVVYGIASRLNELNEMTCALIPSDASDSDHVLDELLRNTNSHAVTDVFQAMAAWMEGNFDAVTPDELREAFHHWAATPYGPRPRPTLAAPTSIRPT